MATDDKELLEVFEDNGNHEVLRKMGGIQGVCDKLKVDVSKGLSSGQDIENRRSRYGSNEVPERKYPTYFELLFNALKDLTLIILMVAAVVSIVLNEVFSDEDKKTAWIEGGSILLAVIVVSNVTAANEFGKDKQFRLLEKEKDKENVFVLRDGSQIQIPGNDLVVGDIIFLERGNKIPADGLCVEGTDLRIDQANLTGESDAIKKDDNDPFLLSGCIVAEGDAKMLVVAVGVNTQYGQILVNLEVEETKTPLQEQLDDLASKIGYVGLSCGAAVFVALTAWWVTQHFITHTKHYEAKSLEDFIQYFIISVTIVVVAVPEGLPLAVTISLAWSMKKMMKDNNLVRHLKACETMGGVTNICTDKTGTLTENRMTVVDGWIANAKPDQTPPALRDIIVESISVNSKAIIRKRERGAYEYLGNKTECALLLFITQQLEASFEDTRKRFHVVKQFAFSSERKRMSTIITGEHNQVRFHCKGASEIMLELCTNVLSAQGAAEPLSKEKRSQLVDFINKMAAQGLRTLTIAYRELGSVPEDVAPEELENNLTLICIVGIKDPLRNDVREAVELCKRAGIIVRMVTGDNIQTATRIAADSGILDPFSPDAESKIYTAMEGKTFRTLNDDEAKEALSRLRVLARSTPTDKKLLVNRLKRLGEVVAVTGDGTNDAPALKEAHIGLSMGIEGTAVAKQSSDIVILDDNFSSIVKSVMWGRNIRENIQKFLQFQLTVNLVALIVAFVSAVTNKGTPLKAVQLLWVNLIMDTLGALALGTEPPNQALLYHPPVGKRHPLISAVMWRNILIQASYQLFILFGTLYIRPIYQGLLHAYADGQEDEDHSGVHYTIIFNAFVWCQLVNEINSRKVKQGEYNIFQGLHRNLIFIAILVITAACQVMFVEISIFNDIFKTKHLTWQQWLFCLAAGFASFFIGAIVRFIPAPAIWCCKVQREELAEEEDEHHPLLSSSPDLQGS